MQKIIKFIHEHECLRRSLRTFAQAFTGSIVVSLSSGTEVGQAFLQTMIMSALAAGIAAVMNADEEKKEEK